MSSDAIAFPSDATQDVVQTGLVMVNVSKGTVMVNDAFIHLTAKEYQVLEILALRKGSTVTREMILDHLYKDIDEPELKIIDVFVCKLRKKLGGAANGQHCIDTEWGRGYALKDPT